jgi:shikimate kinase
MRNVAANGNVVLVGPMGSGKSTLGRVLAARLGLGFVDVDAAIEVSAGHSIAAIFETEGEAGFRRRETDTLRAVLAGAPAVIATGGGAVLDAGNRAAMRAAGTVIYLAVDPATQLARLQDDTDRPLLQTADPAGTLAALQALREPLYREVADLVFDTTALSPQAAADALADRLETREDLPA